MPLLNFALGAIFNTNDDTNFFEMENFSTKETQLETM